MIYKIFNRLMAIIKNINRFFGLERMWDFKNYFLFTLDCNK